jgi:hypothetical protein
MSTQQEHRTCITLAPVTSIWGRSQIDAQEDIPPGHLFYFRQLICPAYRGRFRQGMIIWKEYYTK